MTHRPSPAIGKLLGVLGLDPRRTMGLQLIVEPGDVVKVVVTMLPCPWQVEGIADALDGEAVEVIPVVVEG